MISNSLIPILLTIVISLVLIFLFSLFKSVLPLYFVRFREQKRYLKLLYYSEIIGGILVLAMFTGYLYERSTITAIVLLMILILSVFFIGVFFIKDYVAGLIVKASANYSINDIIITDDIEGKIMKFGQRSLIITSINGNKIFIPYSKLTGKIKSIKSVSEIQNNYSFQVSLSNNNDIDKTIDNIKNFLITLPWVNNSILPDIKIDKKVENNYTLSISIVSYDNSYYVKIESAVLEKFS